MTLKQIWKRRRAFQKASLADKRAIVQDEIEELKEGQEAVCENDLRHNVVENDDDR
jgi:hypothetical protein